jgi:sugar phosphate isomerase/epimerase
MGMLPAGLTFWAGRRSRLRRARVAQCHAPLPCFAMSELSLAPGAGFEVRSEADLDTYLGAVAAAGFPCVSLGINQLVGGPARAAHLLATHGLRCSDLISLPLSRHDDEVLARAAELADAASVLGADHVLSLFWTRVNEESIDRFGRCADMMQRAGTRLALEMPPIGELNSISAAGSVVDEVGYGRASLLIDTFHFSRGRSTWEELESFPLEALGYVQFDDALPPESDDVMHETMDRRAMPGDGEFELERFVATLTGRGWSGLVSVEVLSEELRQLDIATFARRAYQATAPYWPR